MDPPLIDLMPDDINTRQKDINTGSTTTSNNIDNLYNEDDGVAAPDDLFTTPASTHDINVDTPLTDNDLDSTDTEEGNDQDTEETEEEGDAEEETEGDEDTEVMDDSTYENLPTEDKLELMGQGLDEDALLDNKVTELLEEEDGPLTSSDTKDEEEQEDAPVEETWDMEGDDQVEEGHASVDESLEAGDNVNTSFDEEQKEKLDDMESPWINEDGSDQEAEIQEQDEEDVVEQGTVEEVDTGHLESTLEQALDALKEEEQSSPYIQDNNTNLIGGDILDDGLLQTNHTLDPTTSHEQQSTAIIVGPENGDMMDISLLLFVAVCILICFRLPHVKRFFTKLLKKQDASSSTLPYHTTYNKEQD
ncbi:uncharacterized protein BX664DRAFT_386886 [Halteromyces radiatus]|uniref:uncharacterized protein n=1 Tax=Halteromyces radiatus TaxID=101107 RepID=UPI00221FBB98|nr:uncharacterized protein BX664DRAFT_386886 [Halteromyces radiatus]KAI8086474.1 hypothetical protein BX664DRAFT_386886 [Halteromyces radiatus]